MILINLNGRWQMKRTDETSWLDAIVPGSVYNDLLIAGKIEDPFYRDNEYKAMEISKFDYEYRRDFIIDNNLLKSDKVVLLCEGLDTLCTISINNKRILNTNNMHRKYEIDIKDYLILGTNIIHVLFNSPLEYVLSKQKESLSINVGTDIPGISSLRKAHCMFGWDWGPKLPDMGIWRNITIRGYENGRIDDVYITQNHVNSRVELDIRLKIQKLCNSSFEALVKITSPNSDIIEKKILLSNEEDHIFFDIQNPMLWWPNTFGDQPLYKVTVILLENNKELDSKNLTIGLRTLTVRNEKDQWGESFEFVVNGVSIFAMGADYIPEDNILARCNKEKTEKLIKSCVEANFNSIRVWGGAFYPEDYFYELCDEYGLIVWQDHMYACGAYEFTEDFKVNITQETIDNMRKFRHHASLGLWCGNNEQEVAWVDLGWSEKYPLKLKADYIKHYEVLLPGIAKAIDPNTFYWLASPSSSGSFFKPNDENYGDMHYWGVWHGREPFTSYRKLFPRFMSEFGLQSFPSLKTVKTFTLPDDRNIFSYVMESHQKSGTGNEKILYYISETYKYPKDFDSLIYVSQLIQAEGLKCGVQHWRRHRGRCMGAIYWQLNDCWPVASWSSIDYFGRWKALHYAAKKFFAPILLSACEEGTNVSLHVSNETMKNIYGTIEWNLMDTKSNIIETGKKAVEASQLSSKECMVLDFSKTLDTLEKQRNSYLEFKLVINDEIICFDTVLFVKPKHFCFIDPNIKVSVTEKEDKFSIEVTSKSFARFVELDLKHDDAIFSDNYFDLSAGDIKTISIKKDNLSKAISLKEIQEQLTIRSLFNSFDAVE